MGGDGYALLRAESDTALAQLRSREKLARSGFLRRSREVDTKVRNTDLRVA